MSAPEVVRSEGSVPTEALPSQLAADRWSSIEAALGRASDWLNPILVKEARQAMKSRQFSITFILLLISAVVWSLVGITLLLPAVYYAPGGPFMLGGYYLILALAVLVVVPFMAYRSLVSELEDGTYELLSITSLSSRHIVTGKLGSAIVQMMVYYSAIAPCIAFTFLLRGLSIFSLGVVLVGTFVHSIMLCAIGLVVASVTRNRHWQILLSVLFLGGLAAAFIVWSMFVIGVVISEISAPYQEREFWIGIAAVLTAYAMYFTLLLRIAEALNNFASENRSTRIRHTILVQLVLFIGWMFYPLAAYGMDDDVLIALVFLGLGHCVVYGAFMTGELAQLSPRVKRQLPTTLLGRTFLTLFNPGSATGYAFIVACATTIVLAALGAVLLSPTEMDARQAARVVQLCGLCWGYVAAYLGLGRLILFPLRRVVPQGFAVAVLVHLVLMLAGCGIPVLMEAYLNDFRPIEYSGLQVTNWSWTLEETLDRGMDLHPEVLVGVPLAGTVMLVVNLVQGSAEFRRLRQALPERVVEELRVES